MAQANVSLLNEALQRAGALVTIPPDVVNGIRRVVTEGADTDVFQINPVRFARTHGFDEHQTVGAFVAAAKAGVFEFTWALTCPMCGMYAHRTHALSGVSSKTYCAVCNREGPSLMDSVVEVCFRVHPAVRPLPPITALVAPQDCLKLYENQCVLLDPGIRRMTQRNVLWNGVVPHGATHTVDLAVPERKTRLGAVTHDVGVDVSREGGKTGVVLRLEDGRFSVVEYTGSSRMVIHNATTQDAVVVVKLDPLPSDFDGPIDPPRFEGFLSGRDLLCNQAFRDLYASDTLAAGIALNVESLCMLFTDLKGSTALYDSIGDVQAFSLVSEHFKILLRAVDQYGGAVVKTIGDAVMATFPDAKDGVKAALHMARTLEKFNQEGDSPSLSLKIGLHVGPCIVVNSNARLDYFGQTVNIAARVQGLAEGDELVVTDEAWRVPGVQEQLVAQDLKRRTGEVTLKGVARPVTVHTITTVAS